MTSTAPPPPDARRRRRGWRLGLIAFLVVAVAVGGYAWWMETGRHMFQPRNWGVVDEGRIWRSGQIHGRLIEDVLRERGIDVILDLAPDEPGDEHAARERSVAEALGIRKVDAIGLDGYGQGPLEDYVRALAELLRARERGEKVLVHCAGGSERTGVLVAYYRMLYQGWDGERAWREYLAFRDKPPVNDYLPRYVNAHLPDLVERMRALGQDPLHPAPAGRFGPLLETE